MPWISQHLPQRQTLDARSLWGFSSKGGERVSCVSGELWITGPKTGDQVLAAGESLQISGSGRVVVQALRASCVEVHRR